MEPEARRTEHRGPEHTADEEERRLEGRQRVQEKPSSRRHSMSRNETASLQTH